MSRIRTQPLPLVLLGFGVSLSVRPLVETGGILFREYCFREDNSLSLTEFWGRLGEFCKELGEFAFSHK